MQQAVADNTGNVLPLHQPRPMTEAERSRNYRARERLKKLARKPRDAKKRVTKAVTESVTPTVTEPVTAATPTAPRDAVDLAVLRREIADWVKVHHEVDRLRTGRQPWNPRFVFFVIGVAFYAFLAYSAVG